MESETICKMTAGDLREAFIEPIRREVITDLKNKLNEKIINSETVASIHMISLPTLYKYVESGDVPTLRTAESGKLLFRLGDVIDLDFQKLKQQLKQPKHGK